MSQQGNSNVGMWIAIGLGGFVLLIVLALPILGVLFFYARSTSVMVGPTALPAATALAETASHQSTTTQFEGDQPAIVIESEQQLDQLQNDLLQLDSVDQLDERIGSVSYEQTIDRVTIIDPSGSDPPQIIKTIHRTYPVGGAMTGRLTVDLDAKGVTSVSFFNVSP